MKTIKLTKMQGCGNDFIIADYSEYEKTGLAMDGFAKKVCDRNFGVGADGLIIPDLNTEGADIGWYFYNADGTTAQMCGNGMRCFAKYVFDNGILPPLSKGGGRDAGQSGTAGGINSKAFSVKTGAGIIKPEILDNGLVKVNMGMPILEDEKIPFKGKRKIFDFEITPVSMGNPHCVIFTDKEPVELAKKYGPDIEKHEYFPEKTNVEFVRVLSRDEIDMCVYERGCGITLACGTGACASVAAGVLNNLTQGNVKVNLLGGAVFIEWQGSKDNPDKDIFLTGPADYVFKAEYML
ncbi:MAG: diaminopimelate epimerase [Heliobacteriaceae bacterium]|jgi:diaminopimelate epimerase|nr:diaminopimelate epimerase [Heliobacteriaceae bacterium]